MSIKTSVIIITYNQAGSISRAIDSILAQRYTYPYEIVIGDDASTDGTRHICEQYAGKHPDIIRLMPQAPNKGIVGNYFDCLEACRGEYFADCAGDDYWEDPLRLQRQTEYLDSHPGDAAVISDWEMGDGTNTRHSQDLPEYAPFRRHLAGKDMRMLTLCSIGAFPMLSAMLMRRKPIADILASSPGIIRQDRWKCEDVAIIAHLAGAGAFGYLPLDAMHYSIEPQSVTNTRDSGRIFDFYCSSTLCVAELSKILGIPLPEILPALRHRLDFLAGHAVESRDPARRDALEQLCSLMPEAVTPKIKIYRFAMKHKQTWRLLFGAKHLAKLKKSEGGRTQEE